MKCAVANCNSQNDYKACTISFFPFPPNDVLKKKWVNFCRSKKKFNPNTSFICNLHFKPEDITNKLQYEMGFAKRRLLKRGVVPSIQNDSIVETETSAQRTSRIEKRENKKIVETLLQESCAEDAEQSRQEIEYIEVKVEPYSFDTLETVNENVLSYTGAGNESLNSLKTELYNLRKENYVLKETSKTQTAELKKLKEQTEKDCKLYEKCIISLKTRIMKANYELTNLEEKLLGIFTKSQIAKVKAGGKRKIWTEEDMTQASTMYAASSKVYKLLYRKQFPLPAIRTLQAWSQKAKKK